MIKRQRLNRELTRYDLYFQTRMIEAVPHTYERLRLPEETMQLLELARLTMNRIKPVPPRMDEDFFENLAFVRGCLLYAGGVSPEIVFRSAGMHRRRHPVQIRSPRKEKFSSPNRQYYDASMWHHSLRSKPHIDAIRESERLTATDLAVTINCRS